MLRLKIFAAILLGHRILLRKTDRLPVKQRKRGMPAARPHSFLLCVLKWKLSESIHRQTKCSAFAALRAFRLPVKRRKMNMPAARSHSFVLARFKLEVGREKYEQTGDGGVYSRYISKL